MYCTKICYHKRQNHTMKLSLLYTSLNEHRLKFIFSFFILIFISAFLATKIFAQPAQYCAKKYIGDADCKSDSSGKAVTILDNAIWYSEFIGGCSSANIVGCSNDTDGNGYAMDANFNYPGTSYISTDNKVDVFDYAVWIQGFLADTGGAVSPTITPVVTSGITPSTTISVTPTIGMTTITPTQAPATGAAFPEAEGFGAQSRGGRGGKVIYVSNLNGSGAGSFRECALSSGARTCIFRVTGTINLGGDIIISNPFLTVAGQSAPGDGIAFTGGTISIRTNNVIMRYFRTRNSTDGINMIGVEAHDIMLDHITSTWTVDENMSTYTGSNDRVKNVSVQWSLLAEGLAPHSKGILLGYATNISIHHNLFAHNQERNPRCQVGDIDVVNNVIYNYGASNGWCDTKHGPVRLNYIANYTKKGLDSAEAPEMRGDAGVTIYAKGNLGPHRTSDTGDEWSVVGGSYTKSTTQFPYAKVTTTSAAQAYAQVLAQAGASARLEANGTFVSMRDSFDTRVINDVKNGTGRIVSIPGTMPTLASGTPYPDADQDGMSDTWESVKGLSVGTADYNGDKDGDTVTNLEEFLGGTTP